MRYLMVQCTGLFFFASLMSLSAKAVENLTIPVDQVRVYASPSTGSPVISILKKGQVVQAGSNPGAGFKKVLVSDASGKKVIGYVMMTDLTPPIFPVEKSGEEASQKKKKNVTPKTSGLGLKKHYTLGLNIGADYQYQNTSTVTAGSVGSASVTGLTGTNLMFGVSVNIPIKPLFSVEADLNYKPSGVTGTGNTPTTTQPSNIVKEETFIAVSGTAKFYAGNTSDWWYGAGLEYDYASSGTIQIGSLPTYTMVSSDLKSLVLLYGATGYDFSSSKTFYITPTFRLGGTVAGSPFQIEFDVIVTGSYRF